MVQWPTNQLPVRTSLDHDPHKHITAYTLPIRIIMEMMPPGWMHTILSSLPCFGICQPYIIQQQGARVCHLPRNRRSLSSQALQLMSALVYDNSTRLVYWLKSQRPRHLKIPLLWMDNYASSPCPKTSMQIVDTVPLRLRQVFSLQ